MGRIIKCISLWQPWATAMARGFKRNETRSWPTSYTGALAIHAAKRKFDLEEYGEDWVEELRGLGLLDGLVYGAVLCIVDLKYCRPTAKVKPYLDHHEEMLGNYDSGRFAWCTDNLRILPHPIPLRGMQGLFDWNMPTEIEKLIPEEELLFGRGPA